MADAEANPDPVPSAPTGTGGGKGAVETGGIEIIKTPTGILMIINIVRLNYFNFNCKGRKMQILVGRNSDFET